MEPSRPTATMLLGAILSDTVILNSPTTTERDHAVVDYLERVLALDAIEFGREMFEADLRRLRAARRGDRRRATPRSTRSAGGQTICIAQIETVGEGLLERRDELLEAMDAARERKGYCVCRADGHRHPHQGHRPAGRRATVRTSSAPSRRRRPTAWSSCPGVMSRKKQVAPKLLAAAAR